MPKSVNIYADAIYLQNSNQGGWAVFLTYEDGENTELSGALAKTTENRLHLHALINALSHLSDGCEVKFFTPCSYVCSALNKGWLSSWIAKGWKTYDNKAVKNKDLWEQVLPLLGQHQVKAFLLSSQKITPQSKRCAALAQNQAQQTDPACDLDNSPSAKDNLGNKAKTRTEQKIQKLAAFKNAPKVTIYTDGSCLGNPGPGGWAALIFEQEGEPCQEICGGFRLTTNNRMEILSVIKALEILEQPSVVDLYSDSQYLCKAINEGWLKSWIKRNWINSAKKPVKNRDLWEILTPLLEKHRVTLHWIEGHAGHEHNERCDALARNAASLDYLPADHGFK